MSAGKIPSFPNFTNKKYTIKNDLTFKVKRPLDSFRHFFALIKNLFTKKRFSTERNDIYNQVIRNQNIKSIPDKFKGCKITVESDGSIKEVYDPKTGIFYQGNLKNFSRDGKGKIQYKDGSTYDGFFENNKRHGIGKFTNKDGDVYEGAWKNGKRHGKGKMTCANSSYSYDGDWENDKFHGQGVRIVQKNGDEYKYSGVWNNNKFEKGKCTIEYQQGVTLVKTYLNGKINEVKRTSQNGDIYEGQWENNEPHGHGKFSAKNGEYKEGQWHYGSFIQGKINIIKDNNDVYEGYFKDGKYNGEGKVSNNDGEYKSGHWKNGNLYNGTAKTKVNDKPDYLEKKCIDGQYQEKTVKYIYKNGDIYEGEMKDGIRYGEGKLSLKGMGTFEGTWVDDKFESGHYREGVQGKDYIDIIYSNGQPEQAKRFYPDGEIYQGGWKDGAPYGQGKTMINIDVGIMKN